VSCADQEPAPVERVVPQSGIAAVVFRRANHPGREVGNDFLQANRIGGVPRAS
jgi:hypothetical protein